MCEGGDGAMQGQELDFMVLVGPFQLNILCDLSPHWGRGFRLAGRKTSCIIALSDLYQKSVNEFNSLFISCKGKNSVTYKIGCQEQDVGVVTG